MASVTTNLPKDDELENTNLFDVIEIVPHKIKYINPQHKKVKAKMYDYNCDIKLCVGGANFKAHKEVLSSASDYFSAMFSHDMLEKDRPVVELLELGAEGFTQLLDYFYHGHLTLTPDCIEDILEAARFFQVPWVVEVCCDFLVHQLSLDSYQTVLQLADTYQLGDLTSDIFRFLGMNLMELVKEEDFYLNFDSDLLIQFLRGDVFVEADEEFVLELITNWVTAVPEERKSYLLPLLRLVRFPLMDADSLSNLHPDILQWPEIEDAVEEAKHYVNDVPGQSLCSGLRFLQRGSTPNVLMFDFCLDGCQVHYCNVATGVHIFETVAHTGEDSKLDTSSIAKVGNFLYRAGGYNDAICSSALVYRYNPTYRCWQGLADMTQARVSHAMCATENRIFVLGGIEHTIGDFGDEDRILASVEMYDVKENCWSDLPNIPTGSYNQAAAYIDGGVYLSGGISADPFDDVPMASLWKLDVAEGCWRGLKDMLYPRQGHSMTALDDKLYVFGGYTRGGTGRTQIFKDCYNSEVYDLGSHQWTEIKAIPETFGHVMSSVGLWNRRFFFFGGGVLHSYYVDEDRMEYGEHVGSSIQKIAILDVALPT